jgi:hypothetical protein
MGQSEIEIGKWKARSEETTTDESTVSSVGVQKEINRRAAFTHKAVAANLNEQEDPRVIEEMFFKDYPNEGGLHALGMALQLYPDGQDLDQFLALMKPDSFFTFGEYLTERGINFQSVEFSNEFIVKTKRSYEYVLEIKEKIGQLRGEEGEQEELMLDIYQLYKEMFKWFITGRETYRRFDEILYFES